MFKLKIKNRFQKLLNKPLVQSQIIITILFCFLFLGVFVNKSKCAAVCTPASAELCAAVDDIAMIYINGIYIDTFGYQNVGSGTPPKCENLTTAELNSLGATNVIAVRDQNTNCCEIWATWSMDITCTDGGHTYVDSDYGTGVDYSYDSNQGCCTGSDGNPATCDAGPSEGGYTWYNPLYNENGTWSSATGITYYGQEYGQKITSFETHNVLVPLGYGGETGGQQCQVLYFRQGFTLNEIATPAPPNLTITKTSISPPTNIGAAGDGGDNPYIQTFAYTICNTGGGVTTPVCAIDQWTDTISQWQFQGPFAVYGITQGGIYFGDITATGTTSPPFDYACWNEGFPGVTCTGCTEPCMSFTYILETWNFSNPNSFCINWANTVSLSAATSLTICTGANCDSSVALKNFCPSDTSTYTSTPTFTKTPTYTPTYTYTSTYTSTLTYTYTLTATPTQTPMPPVWTLQKTALNANPISVNDISFSLAVCNNGGIVTQAFTVYDSWANASPPDSWSYAGPYNGPGGEISGWSDNTGTNSVTWLFTPQSSGFTGCFTFILNLDMYSGSPGNCNWNNNASLGYQGQPSVVSTVNMQDVCGTKTDTPTYTYTQTLTMTNTPVLNSPTFTPTYTYTRTYTYTSTMTYTSTPTPQIALTKTESSTTVMLGGTVQYCLNYYNTGSATASFNIWDTIPAVTNFVSCTGSCTQTTYGSNVVLSWSISSLAAGGNGSVCFVVQVVAVPYLIDDRDLFGMIDEEKLMKYKEKQLRLIEPESKIYALAHISRGSP